MMRRRVSVEPEPINSNLGLSGVSAPFWHGVWTGTSSIFQPALERPALESMDEILLNAGQNWVFIILHGALSRHPFDSAT